MEIYYKGLKVTARQIASFNSNTFWGYFIIATETKSKIKCSQCQKQLNNWYCSIRGKWKGMLGGNPIIQDGKFWKYPLTMTIAVGWMESHRVLQRAICAKTALSPKAKCKKKDQQDLDLSHQMLQRLHWWQGRTDIRFLIPSLLLPSVSAFSATSHLPSHSGLTFLGGNSPNLPYNLRSSSPKKEIPMQG